MINGQVRTIFVKCAKMLGSRRSRRSRKSFVLLFRYLSMVCFVAGGDPTKLHFNVIIAIKLCERCSLLTCIRRSKSVLVSCAFKVHNALASHAHLLFHHKAKTT